MNMYGYVYMCLLIYMYIHTYACISCMYKCIYHICMYVHRYAKIHMYVGKGAQFRIHVYIYLYVEGGTQGDMHDDVLVYACVYICM